MKKRRILVSNDDGIESPGIQELAKALAQLGEVTVVAPARERSTSGHSLTLHKPLRMFDLGKNQFAVTGTPADCIYFATRAVMQEKPDVIVSGINSGANLGTDVHYSGTVAAAREGALMNIPSYAVSLVDMKHPGAEKGEKLDLNYKMAAEISVKIMRETFEMEFPPHTLMNINIPNIPKDRIQGLKVARQGFRFYQTDVARRQDPRGRDYFWIGGPYMGFQEGEETDCHFVEKGWVSLTPITIDCTHNEYYATLKRSPLNDLELCR